MKGIREGVVWRKEGKRDLQRADMGKHHRDHIPSEMRNNESKC
jgi:hypothetical protein